MDALLGGYKSDSSSSSNDRGGNAPPPPLIFSTANPSASSTSSGQQQQTAQHRRRGRGGKRLLSLGAILPPEIFDRLTRTSHKNGEDDDDSSSSVSSSSSDDGRTTTKQSRKRDGMQQKQRSGPTERTATSDKPAGRLLGGDKDLNLLLNELRSTPITSNNNAVVSKSTIHSTAAGSRKNNNSREENNVEKDTQGEFLGMAFMNYTSSSSTKIGGSGDKTVVVDVHATPTLSAVATPIPPPQFRRAIQSAPPNCINNNASIDQPAVDDNDNSYDNSIIDYSNNNNDSNNRISNNNINRPDNSGSSSGVIHKSRKQLREEEQSLRSGHIAFDNYSANVYHQPSPTEFAPTAHAAAIASKAARRIAGSSSGGGGGHSSIAMYDPKQGMEVSGLGVTGKHRSKHQINQLMASAISLEAHRASEAELARFGAGAGAGGKGNSRTDAKRKYGW